MHIVEAPRELHLSLVACRHRQPHESFGAGCIVVTGNGVGRLIADRMPSLTDLAHISAAERKVGSLFFKRYRAQIATLCQAMIMVGRFDALPGPIKKIRETKASVLGIPIIFTATFEVTKAMGMRRQLLGRAASQHRPHDHSVASLRCALIAFCCKTRGQRVLQQGYAHQKRRGSSQNGG